MQLIVEGWRWVPHSFALVNQFQLVELARRPEVQLAHRDMPYFASHWKPIQGLLPAKQDAILQAIPTAPPGQPADATLRIFVPYQLQPDAASARTFIWGTTEYGVLQNELLRLMGIASLADPAAKTDVTWITCSEWSRRGFVRSGVEPERVRVVPLGFDPDIYRAAAEHERKALRERVGGKDTFVFLNVGLMTFLKGTSVLLKAFARVAEKHPHARLLVKASDAFGSSTDKIRKVARKHLTPAEVERVEQRLICFPHVLTCTDMACLYQIADAYVSPYLGEGFNLPVLEAGACGLPVICTGGGPTDDFTDPCFAQRIDSTPTTVVMNEQERYVFQPDVEHLAHLMMNAITETEIAAQARRQGPEWLRERFTWKHTVDKLAAILQT